MAGHAKLGPSAAHRWMICPGSVRLSEGIADETSEAAEEGTLAHAVAERHAAAAFGLGIPTLDAPGPDETADMALHASEYADALVSLVGPKADVWLESRVGVNDEVWGTTDALALAEDGETLVVMDYKYGRGYVEVVENPQLMLYGLGAIGGFSGVKVVRLAIYQPRAGREALRTWDISAADLRAWGDTKVLPAVEATKAPDAPAVPSEKGCQWCPIRATCRARSDQVLSQDFGVAGDLLDDTELADRLAMLSGIRSWIGDVEQEAYRRAESTGLPGWKLIEGPSRRFIRDHDAAMSELTELFGLDIEEVAPRTLVGLTALDKLVGGRDVLAQAIPDQLGTTRPKPKLVPESAPGDELPSVRGDFG